MNGIQVSSRCCSRYNTEWRRWLVCNWRKGELWNFFTLTFEGINCMYYTLTGWRVGVLSCCFNCCWHCCSIGALLRRQPEATGWFVSAACLAAAQWGSCRQQHPPAAVAERPLRAERREPETDGCGGCGGASCGSSGLFGRCVLLDVLTVLTQLEKSRELPIKPFVTYLWFIPLVKELASPI